MNVFWTIDICFYCRSNVLFHSGDFDEAAVVHVTTSVNYVMKYRNQVVYEDESRYKTDIKY